MIKIYQSNLNENLNTTEILEEPTLANMLYNSFLKLLIEFFWRIIRILILFVVIFIAIKFI